MMSKKSLIVLLLVFAVLLSVFSLVMSFGIDSPSAKGQSQQGEPDGNVNLVILQPTDSQVSVVESGEGQ